MKKSRKKIEGETARRPGRPPGRRGPLKCAVTVRFLPEEIRWLERKFGWVQAGVNALVRDAQVAEKTEKKA